MQLNLVLGFANNDGKHEKYTFCNLYDGTQMDESCFDLYSAVG